MATVHDGTGQNWSETDPEDGDPASDGAQEIRDLRTGLRKRLEYEHTTPAGSTAGGKHKKGSARAYAQSGAPTQQPDGSTALGASDDGRFWVDTDDGLLQYWNGSAWTDIIAGTANGVADDSIVTADLQDDSVTAAKLNSDVAGAGLTQNGDGSLSPSVDGTSIELDGSSQVSIKDGAFSADASGRALMADGFLTAAKLASGSEITRVHVGTYTGDGGTSNAVTGVGFKPDLVFIHRRSFDVYGFVVGIRDEAAGSPETGNLVGTFAAADVGLAETQKDAIQYDSDGFTLKKSDINHNESGDTYTYLAFKFE